MTLVSVQSVTSLVRAQLLPLFVDSEEALVRCRPHSVSDYNIYLTSLFFSKWK